GVCILNPTGGCNNALAVDSKGILRLSTDTGDGSHGVTFYLSGPGVAGGGSGGYGSVFFGANAGSTGGSRTVAPFSPTPTDGTGAICSGGAAVNSNLNQIGRAHV